MLTSSATALIEMLRAPDGSLNREAIRVLLPYGDEFLFVDYVSRLSTGEIEATFSIPLNAPYALSHFRHAPIMPGALTGEGMAQAGMLLLRYRLDLPAETDLLVTRVESATFSAPALPGDTMRYTVGLKTVAPYGARLIGQVDVGNVRVCAAQLVLVVVDRQRLRQITSRPRTEGDQMQVRHVGEAL